MHQVKRNATERGPGSVGLSDGLPGQAVERRCPWQITSTWPWRRTIGAVLVVVGSASCSLGSLLNSDKLPPDVSDPGITQTPEGARAAYTGTLSQFRTAVGSPVVRDIGLLSDELSDNGTPIDRRDLPDLSSSSSYSELQKVRGQAAQAIGLLTRYRPADSALAGHLYALQGYAEVFLAELFCSGIPLSTLDFGGDFTYKPGSSTMDVLTHAVALFDTALTLAGDSTRLVQLAQVGRARALLGKGAYEDAAVAVASIPDDYHYDLTFLATTDGGWQNFAVVTSGGLWGVTVPNREGSNGLDWRSSGDPRTSVTKDSAGDFTIGIFQYVYHPDKYEKDGSSPIVLASGVEARLIEAEAALHADPETGTWRTMLNALRTDGTFIIDTQVVAVDNTVSPPDTTFAYDTVWHAGSGGVAGLKPLADPGTPNGRVDLVFRERAFWLFLTGHRQGDLRRLIRQYGRFEGNVYPTGPYGQGVPYGADVTLPIPATESVNPLFTGCASRSA